MAQETKTFLDILNAVREHLGVQSTDTIATNKIKRMINMAYTNDVIPAKRWKWLEKTTKVMHDAYYADSTNYATVTNDSTTVTLNNAPNASLGSFLGYKFAVNGFPEVYEITAHTAGSTDVTIDSQYLGVTSAIANFKIWRDKIDLPVNARETVEVWHNRHNASMKGIGPQEFIKTNNEDPKREGYPAYFNVDDFYDPTPSTGETEADRYRRIEIYPSITLSPVTISIKYIEEVSELDADTDEPVIPISDRAVLVHGALMYAWTSIARDPEQAAISAQLFNAKLSRMMGNVDEGFDKPTIGGKSKYLNAIRSRGLHRKNLSMLSNAGQSSYANPTYAKDIVLEGGNITANFTVDDGITIDGRDISADGAALDGLIAGTEVTLTDNTTEGVVATWTVATYDAFEISYSISRGATLEKGRLSIITDGTTVAIADGGIASIGDTGVTFTGDISGSTVRLLYTTTSTGTDADMQYTEAKWKA